jgi:hypothetical protein
MLQQVCSGPVFTRSRRSRELLQHLVEHGLLGGGEALNELAIGLTVFHRDPTQYHPGIDPIVRVEVGRLRRRLASHYAQVRQPGGWQLALPLGDYLPRLQWVQTAWSGGLAVTPLVCHSELPAPQGFTRLLNGQLHHHLQAEFGPIWRLRHPCERDEAATLSAPPQPGIAHLLEGHVHFDGDYFSTTLQLWSPRTGHQLWSSVVTLTGAPDGAQLKAMCRACTAGIQAALG